MATVFLAACGGDKKPAATAEEATPEKVQQNCADPKWKEQNLGLWYSMCRQPLRW